ncbi:MAG TPA: exosortase A [Burkholderiales bacterium]|nr:exosortase A [Burkholderiales bacterium]
MNESQACSLPDQYAAPRPDAAWTFHAVAALFLALVILLVYHSAVRFTVETWLGNETYMHGFFIPVISGWLIWRERDTLRPVLPCIAWPPLILLFLAGIGWELGYQSGSMVIQQYSVVGMIVLAAWIMLGNTVFRILRFPLLFLFFAVPFGEALIPAMIQFTANFTVDALAFTGIPVYRDGSFISIPSGNWSVIEACSGLRYFVASVTLGVLYAHLAYRSRVKKFLFILAALLVPVFANGARAYLIVMIGHLSNMTLAVGIDHLIYGWIFFGIVMLLLFWVGSWFQEHPALQAGAANQIRAESCAIRTFSAGKLVLAVSAVLMLAIAPFGYAQFVGQRLNQPAVVTLAPPPAAGGWQPSGLSLDDLHPHYLGSAAQLTQNYSSRGKQIFLYAAYFRQQHSGTELITVNNKLVTTSDPVWQQTRSAKRDIRVQGGIIPVTEEKLISGNRQLLVWEWYWIDGRRVNNPYFAKLLEAKMKLWNHRDDAAVVVIATPYQDRADAEANLQDFLQKMLPGIDHMLDRAHR